MLEIHRYKWITNINLRIQFLLVEKFAILLWQDYSWITVSILNNHEKRGNVNLRGDKNFLVMRSNALSLTFRSHKLVSRKLIKMERPLKQWHPTFMNFCVSNCSVLMHTTKLSSLRNIRFWNLQPGKLTNKVLRFVQKDRECFLLRR